MTVSPEHEAAERTAAEYRDQGYVIDRDVPLSTFDSSLSDAKVDLVARKGDEMVLIEIKSRASVRDNALTNVADAAIRLKARADVVWIRDAEEPSSQVVDDYIHRARDIYPKDDIAAFLLAWVALEGAAARVALSEEIVEPRSLPSAKQLLTDLYGNRIISWFNYSRLVEIARTRALVAHGRPADVNEDDFTFLLLFCEFLNGRTFRSYEKTLESIRAALTSDELRHLKTTGEIDIDRRLFQRLVDIVPKMMGIEDLREILRDLVTD